MSTSPSTTGTRQRLVTKRVDVDRPWGDQPEATWICLSQAPDLVRQRQRFARAHDDVRKPPAVKAAGADVESGHPGVRKAWKSGIGRTY